MVQSAFGYPACALLLVGRSEPDLVADSN
jgi:hypothetical protein